MVCLHLSLSEEDLGRGQLVALGDRCAILPVVLPQACAAGKSLDLPLCKCSFLAVPACLNFGVWHC